MKKTLMVLSFAFCATFVFAQNAGVRNAQELQAASKAAPVQADLSKALFTKVATPLITVDFHDGSESNNVTSGTGYTTGVVTSGSEAHAQTTAYSRWHRWPNVNPSTIEGSSDNTMSSVYSYMYQWMGQANFASNILDFCDTAVSSAENGFMMLSMIDQSTLGSGNFNAYIQISTVDASNAGVVDVTFFQHYRKFYDNCYIDYRTSASGNWVPTEINVTGVDVSVNTNKHGMVYYTLPLAAAHQPNLDVRIRYASIEPLRSNAYGYYWIIDDVSVVAADANRLLYWSEEYLEANYGLVPEGMTMNPAWYGHLKNNGALPQNNVTVTINHLDANFANATAISTYNNGTVAAGNEMEPICDPFGWIFTDSMDSRGWTCYGYGSAHGTGVAMPTDTPGDNFLYANLTTDSLSHDFDTMYYNVMGLDTSLVAGGAYRWGHDNGVLTNYYNNYYIYGYVLHGSSWYVTNDPDDVHYYDEGYMVTTAFKTGDVVPAGWVIRGVELVSSPVQQYQSTGTKISAVLLRDSCGDDPSTVSFATVNTGAGIHTVTSEELNDTTIIGRWGNGYRELGQYNTVKIPFPEQPVLRPNSTYRAGYSIEEAGTFVLAHEGYYYRLASPSNPSNMDTIIFFRNNPSTKKYGYNYPLWGYQGTIYDPNHDPNKSGTIWASYYYDFTPMIHLLVGEPQAVTRVNVTINCDSTDFGEVAYGGQAVCGQTITPVEGSSPVMIISPMAQCAVKSLKVDGVEIEPWDDDEETGDPNCRELGDGVLQYRFNEIAGDHTVEVVFTEIHVGIDPVAANVNMNLQPNPATSQVTLNVEGVAGQLDCAIIDMSGRVVYNSTFNAENEQVINLSNLAKGAYFVRITNSNFSKVEKLIVR